MYYEIVMNKVLKFQNFINAKSPKKLLTGQLIFLLAWWLWRCRSRCLRRRTWPRPTGTGLGLNGRTRKRGLPLCEGTRRSCPARGCIAATMFCCRTWKEKKNKRFRFLMKFYTNLSEKKEDETIVIFYEGLTGLYKSNWKKKKKNWDFWWKFIHGYFHWFHWSISSITDHGNTFT